MELAAGLSFKSGAQGFSADCCGGCGCCWACGCGCCWCYLHCLPCFINCLLARMAMSLLVVVCSLDWFPVVMVAKFVTVSVASLHALKVRPRLGYIMVDLMAKLRLNALLSAVEVCIVFLRYIVAGGWFKHIIKHHFRETVLVSMFGLTLVGQLF